MRAKIKLVRKINEIFLCILLVTLKAKYQNDPNNVKKCHMFQVIEIFQARGISRYLLTGLKEHMYIIIRLRLYNDLLPAKTFRIEKF